MLDLEKILGHILGGGLAGLAAGLAEEVMGSNKKWAEADVDTTYNRSARRDRIASSILAGLVTNVTAPLEQPDRLVSMALDLANKLIDRLDEEAKKDAAALREKKAKDQAEAQEYSEIPNGISPFLSPNPLAPNPLVANPLAPTPTLLRPIQADRSNTGPWVPPASQQGFCDGVGVPVA